MKFARLLSLNACLLAALAVGGCGMTPPPPPAPVAGADRPHLVTDLSTLSTEPVNPLKTELSKQTAVLRSTGDPNAPVTYQAAPGLVRQAGDDQHPGDQRLLNDKAAKYANFAQVLLDRVYAQVALAERTDEISGIRMSTDTRAVILTAVMDKNGKLTEIIVEQHSGKAAIDKMMVAACKKALWYKNPPVGALTGDGNYKLTIEGKLETYASLDQKHWSFITHIGLGVE
ncbi:MAG: hypothetical protein Q7S58_17570 [Candidatus Binatus sp.]|uniref:energy transducer TonB n=1 Tax=Candidatus Binatus sp. TaxID=2811406 RepID=UPI0027221E28|nr:hypothetical protein [Candidatus Binatus sp.]MDO8434212.1 hypothetical protein [Candidatus Binatus sp.]